MDKPEFPFPPIEQPDPETTRVNDPDIAEEQARAIAYEQSQTAEYINYPKDRFRALTNEEFEVLKNRDGLISHVADEKPTYRTRPALSYLSRTRTHGPGYKAS